MIRALLWGVGYGAAFALGWWAAGRAPIPAPVPAALDDPATPTSAARCRDRLADVASMIEVLQRARFGAPIPFPADLDPNYQPAAFTDRARQVADACPDVAVDLVDVDCSEFPCVPLWDRSLGGSEWDCPLWAELIPDDRHTIGSPPGYLDAEGRPVSLGWDVPFPAGSFADVMVPMMGDQARRRFARRIDRLLERAEEERGLQPRERPADSSRAR